MDVKTISDGHDGSLCLLRNGKVERHFAAERVNHVKHSKVCEKSIEYFGEDLKNLKDEERERTIRKYID